MPVSYVAIQSGRGRRLGGRPGTKGAAGAAVENRRWQADGRQTVHQPRRLHAGRMKEFRPNGRSAMIDTALFMRSVCVAAIAMVGSVSHAQQTVGPVSATPTPGPTPAVLQNYARVTADRLKKPEDGNWLMFRRSYDGWGFSPLAQITPANVARLQLVWSLSTGQIEGHPAPPIVHNGVM